MQGYRFVMRYYDEGDKIYLFGFSRGAFTARFLARMISTIGILSKGNEEMVTFAYKSYQNYETGTGRFKTREEHQVYMEKFKKTFCRKDSRVFFLGLFDTVNSVGVFDSVFSKPSLLPTVLSTAEHVRHAVSIDERRLKFRPALLAQDVDDSKHCDEDIQEVFFAGNHGDVGGGWPASGNKMMVNEADDPVQLSDIPFAWMITALQEIERKDPENALAFNENVDVFLENFGGKVRQAEVAKKHDPLAFNGGLNWFQVVMWNIMGKPERFRCCPGPSHLLGRSVKMANITPEWLPFKRLELIKQKWVSVYFPPAMGGTRDIPDHATIHPSVLQRMKAIDNYRPKNQGLEYLCKEADASRQGTTNGAHYENA